MDENEMTDDDHVDRYHNAENGNTSTKVQDTKRKYLKRAKRKHGYATNTALVLSMSMLMAILFLAIFFSQSALPTTPLATIRKGAPNDEFLDYLKTSEVTGSDIDYSGARYWRRKWRRRVLSDQDIMNLDETKNAIHPDAAAAITDIAADYSERSCSDLAYRTSSDDPAARCRFARTCNDGDGAFLLSFVFCSFNGKKESTRSYNEKEKQQNSSWYFWSIVKQLSPESFCLLVSPILLLWLILLFRMLGSTAEDCFSPSLEMFSHRCRLPPRFAGVTLLALGNGAPDISATFNAICSDPIEGTQLSLGSLTGGGMFVGTIVAGSIFLLANDNDCVGGSSGGGTSLKCRGALVRDVMVYAVTVVVVFLEFRTGSVGRRTVYVFFGFYSAYVLSVLIADVYHRTVYIPRMKKKADQLKLKQQVQDLRHQQADETDDNDGNKEESLPLIISSEDDKRNESEGKTKISQEGDDSMEVFEVSDGQSSSSQSSPSSSSSSPEGSLTHETDVDTSSLNFVERPSTLQGPIRKGNSHRGERMFNSFRTSSSRMSQSFRSSIRSSINRSPIRNSSLRSTFRSTLKGLSRVKTKTKRSTLKRKFHYLGRMERYLGYDDKDIYNNDTNVGNSLHSDNKATGFNREQEAMDQTLSFDKEGEEGYEIREPSESSALTLGDASASWCGPLKATLRNISNYESTSIRLEEGPLILHGPGGVLDHHKNHHHHQSHDDQHQECHCKDEGHEAKDLLLPPTINENADDAYYSTFNTEEDEIGMLKSIISELRDEWDDLWGDIFDNNEINALDKILLFCELPFIVLRKITIPIPCEGYYCRSLVALSVCLSPLWLCVYIRLAFDIDLFVKDSILYVPIAFVLTVAIAALVLIYSPRDKMPLKFAIPIALLGFAVAASWIDLIGGYLVSLLEFLGVMCRIPSPIMGLTVLAWGNSMGDLSTNVTMARKGLANMALTACFAGPVFNMLIGLGSGFAASTSIQVTLSPSVVTGLLFLLCNCVGIVVCGSFIYGGIIPRQLGYILFVVYATYLVTSMAMQFLGVGDGFI